MASWHRNVFIITGPLYGIHCSPVHSPHKWPWMGSFEVSFADNKQLVVGVAWWRHQMVDFPAQRPTTRSVDVFFDLCLNKRLSKQSRRRWFWHYDNTLMDRDFRRHDAHVAVPYWGHILVLTTQGKCFPNVKAGPDSNVIYHCNDVAWVTLCLKSVSARLLLKNFIYCV